MTVAVILAGGSGTRVGGELPKQFIKVAGKKIIEHTIDAFEQNGNIDEIAVVCNPAFIVMMEQIAADRKWTKLRKILHGGKERYESSLAAINAYSDDDILMFHDAVRPLVSQFLKGYSHMTHGRQRALVLGVGLSIHSMQSQNTGSMEIM